MRNARVIDAHTGEDVRIGGVYDGWRILRIEDWGLYAYALTERVDGRCLKNVPGGPPIVVLCPVWQPLAVRDGDHPAFPGVRVLFLPT